MEKIYEGMEEAYQKIEKIEKELLEMGAIKVAEKTGKPRTMNIVIGTEYQQNKEPLEFAFNQKDPLCMFISENFDFDYDRLIIEDKKDLDMPPMMRHPIARKTFLSKRESLQDLILKFSVVNGIAYETGVISSPSLTFVIVDNSKGSLEETIEYMKRKVSPFIAYNV